MATLLTSGTNLQAQKPTVPLNKRFMFAIGVAFLVATHFFTPNPGGAGLFLSFNPPVWITISIALGMAAYQTARNRVIKYSKLSVAMLISCILLTLHCFIPMQNLAGIAKTNGAMGRSWAICCLTTI
ncbi:lipid A core-O-antigen ligase [Vibrio sp. JCM 19236]|nr:lipid A core-O-antigen ligase [Vibrio sp. JCM 19236]